ncbi:MAG: hypothetical protein JWQ98_2400 [Chlorobi bacterium]|nr:hypothetical protein [Chlorobiota bacterium]
MEQKARTPFFPMPGDFPGIFISASPTYFNFIGEDFT